MVRASTVPGWRWLDARSRLPVFRRTHVNIACSKRINSLGVAQIEEMGKDPTHM
jgi:hypothetical protein